MKCEKCGYEGHIFEFMQESSGVTSVPDEAMKELEKTAQSKMEELDSPLDKLKMKVGFRIFKLISRLGLMPYHATDLVCPECHKFPKEE